MEYRALYRQTRPEVFSEILGQDHIVKILKHQVETDTVSHAYLFCGTRGTGKTTTARILAKAVNCLEPDVKARPCGCCSNCKAIAEGRFIDVDERDAASHNGVDDIRELRESANYPPAVGRKKVYIIDEVHALSTSAFNALLKTLEEPPENVMFILATTNPEKMPQTILSRCMRLDFKRVSANMLAQHMKDICNERGIEISDSALRLLASNADGSVRDSLSILEQCISSGEKKLERETVLDFLGTVSEEFFIKLTECTLSRNISEAFVLLNDALNEGKDVKQLMKDWMAHFRSLLLAKYMTNVADVLNMSEDNIALIRKQADHIELGEINNAIVTLAKTINDARYSTQARILMEVAIVTISSGMEYGKVSQVGRGLKPSATVATTSTSVVSNATAVPNKSVQMSETPESQPGAPAPDVVEQSAQFANSDEPEAPVINGNLADIWDDVFEEAEKYKPSLFAMKNAVLAEIGQDEFKVIVSSEAIKARLEKERELICELMEKRIGKRLGMVCVMDTEENTNVVGDSKADDMKKLEDAAELAGKLLNIKVDIR